MPHLRMLLWFLVSYLCTQHIVAQTDTALLDDISSATGPEDYPARIGKTAEELRNLTQSRFAANSDTLELCQRLYSNTDGTSCSFNGRGYTDDDALVIGFFLGPNTGCTSF